MGAIRKIVAAVTTDALATSDQNIIPQESGGAFMTVYASSVTKTDAFGLNVGSTVVIPGGTNANIESSADVIDVDRDLIMANQYVPPGKITLAVSALTTEMQFLILWTPRLGPS